MLLAQGFGFVGSMVVLRDTRTRFTFAFFVPVFDGIFRFMVLMFLRKLPLFRTIGKLLIIRQLKVLVSMMRQPKMLVGKFRPEEYVTRQLSTDYKSVHPQVVS